jgi:predicted Zn finger-like uncharacterized protein
MRATCPHCATAYRIDPSKVPGEGVRARCAVCRGLFRVEPDRPVEAGPAQTEMEPAATAIAAPAADAGQVAVGSASRTDTTAAVTGAEAHEPAPEPPAPAAASLPPAPLFGSTDPKTKARRLARALVSDMATYHPDRRERAIRDGTLRQEFREEIRKSWQEYVDQVGPELAHGTAHFREALNEILARGQKVF